MAASLHVDIAGSGQIDDETFAVDGQRVQVGIFPVGVETEAFARLARRAAETTFVREVLDSITGRALIIGVDRLDYSKGIPERMNAFDRFLANYPDWRNKVTYLQITPRSRTDIQEYADIGRTVGETVGRPLSTRKAIAEGDKEKATAALRVATRKLDKAVSKGVIHKNQAANRKSAIAKQVAAL